MGGLRSHTDFLENHVSSQNSCKSVSTAILERYSIMYSVCIYIWGASRKLATSVNQGDNILTMLDVLKLHC